MADTAVVNPRRRRRRPARRRRRRRNPESYGAAANPRRRRRRTYAPRKRRRRRNPSPYSSGGYYQRPNPNGALDFNEAMAIIPAGTMGIAADRWAINMAGPFEQTPEGTQVPGVKHAFAIWLAASFASPIIGNILGDSRKAEIAKIAALSWGGDLFTWKRFMSGNQWAQQNLYLAGFQEQSALASGMGQDTFIDAAGNKYVRQPGGGWQLAGFEESSPLAQADGAITVPEDARAGDIITAPDGQRYRLTPTSSADEFGLEPIGNYMEGPRRSMAGDSSFGYVAA